MRIDKVVGFALALCVAVPIDAHPLPVQRQHELPSMQEIRALERAIRMPAGAGPLNAYGRTYTLAGGNPREIRGIFLRSTRPGLRIVPPEAFTEIDDGGCDVVHIRYARAKRKITAAFCGGVA